MNNQMLIDMVALAQSDVAMLNLFEKAREYSEDGNGSQWQLLMELIVQAIDNTYGDGSFDLYKNAGILPSKQ